MQLISSCGCCCAASHAAVCNLHGLLSSPLILSTLHFSGGLSPCPCSHGKSSNIFIVTKGHDWSVTVARNYESHYTPLVHK